MLRRAVAFFRPAAKTNAPQVTCGTIKTEPVQTSEYLVRGAPAIAGAAPVMRAGRFWIVGLSFPDKESVPQSH